MIATIDRGTQLAKTWKHTCFLVFVVVFFNWVCKRDEVGRVTSEAGLTLDSYVVLTASEREGQASYTDMTYIQDHGQPQVFT